MTIPNLSGVIKKDDVFRKGNGTYAADYVSWARIANHLHTSAPGWAFNVKPNPDGGHVWQAPDGSGYLVTYFTGPDRGTQTPDFLFPCQDNRNQPIPYEKVNCRTLTDTHRRALCANAAFAFSLGYELWAREEIQSSDGETQLLAKSPAASSLPPLEKPAAEASVPTLGKAAQAGQKAIASAKTLEALKALGERLTTRHKSGDLNDDEHRYLFEQLLAKEDELAQ
jgi:hypothetical protein